ncbi:MAG: polysaccharide deacetylase family protein [Candidatus Omnitrophica bacterium]|nr:polysaccharide deacetylase family protein [Candidatus Omnitrophota bacterium]
MTTTRNILSIFFSCAAVILFSIVCAPFQAFAVTSPDIVITEWIASQPTVTVIDQASFTVNTQGKSLTPDEWGIYANVHTNLIPVTQNTVYTLKGNINVTAGSLDIVVDEYDGNSGYVSSQCLAVINDQRPLSYSYKAPAGVAYISVYFNVASVDSTVNVSNVILMTAVQPKSYTDFSKGQYEYYYLQLPFQWRQKNFAVIFNFDDAWTSMYTNAAPVLNEKGIKAVVYVITGAVGQSGYMTANQIKQLYGKGYEIGSHSVNHLDLVALRTSNYTSYLTQLQGPITYLKKTIGKTYPNYEISGFAIPFFSYNDAVRRDVTQRYRYSRNGSWSSRTGEYPTFNVYPFDPSDIVCLESYDSDIGRNLTVQEITEKIEEARAEGRVIVLLFHKVGQQGQSTVGAYEYPYQDFKDVVSYVSQNGMKTTTTLKLLNEVAAEISQKNIIPKFNTWGINNANVTADSVKLTLKGAAAEYLISSTAIPVTGKQSYIGRFQFDRAAGVGEVDINIDAYGPSGNYLGTRTILASSKTVFNYYPFYYQAPDGASAIKIYLLSTANSTYTAVLKEFYMWPVTLE